MKDKRILRTTCAPEAKQESAPGKEQLAAIKHGDGPCLVLAAPGSGKTYVVTQRFIRLVREEGISTDQILALAYNRRAADEMLARVEQELGPISGDPPLTTYHSWAITVLRRFGWRIGWPETFRIASGAEKSMHLADVLKEVKPASLYDPARPYESVRNINRLIERAKQELVDPETYIQHVEEQLELGPTGEEKLQWDRQRDVAQVYTALQERYRDQRLIDHDDAIAFAARLLRDDPEVREAYQSIRYVMVDEFQDTNSAQAEMIEALVAPHGNLMVVADDDQAIYRFRGASRLNIQRFRRTFPTHVEIPLSINRRSTPEIVALSQAVISASPEREPKLVEAVRPPGEPVQLVWSREYRDEVQTVVTQVKKHLAEGCLPRDIAVLTQFRADMEPFANGFRDAGVPYVLDRGHDLFRAVEVKGIMALLEAICDPEASQALMRCLQLPAWSMSGEGRREVLRAVTRTDVPLVELLASGSLTELSDEDRARGQLIAADLNALQAMALVEDVREVFQEGMLRTEYPALGDVPDTLARMQFAGNVSRFYEVIDEYCRYRKDAYLADTLEYLRLVRETGDEKEAAIDADLDAVLVSTIHGAKGLEWSHVFVSCVVQNKIPKPVRPDDLVLPPTLVEGVADLPDSHKEEQRRLFYVALSRAKDTLTVTWAKKYANDFREQKRTEFLERLPADLWDPREQPAGILAMPQRRQLPPLTRNGQLILSYSAIQDFRDCPRRFEYRSLWRMPPIFSPQGWYGERLHNALYSLGQLRLGGKNVDPDVVESVWMAEWDSAGDRGRVRELRDEGLRVLSQYVESPLWREARLDTVEYSFKLPIEDQANWALTGKVDRIDIGDDGIPTVVDYKSGRPGAEDSVAKSLQLKIYARVALDKYGCDSVRASLHWLQSASSASVTWTEKDIERYDYGLFMSFEQIEGCHNSGHFKARPSAYKCRQCAFRLICPERAE